MSIDNMIGSIFLFCFFPYMIEVGLAIILGFKGNLNNFVSGKDEPSSVVFITDINLIYNPPFGNDSFILTCNN